MRTVSSSFNSSIVRLVKSARNISSIVMASMNKEADSLMGRMEINPVSDMQN